MTHESGCLTLPQITLIKLIKNIFFSFYREASSAMACLNINGGSCSDSQKTGYKSNIERIIAGYTCSLDKPAKCELPKKCSLDEAIVKAWNFKIKIEALIAKGTASAQLCM